MKQFQVPSDKELMRFPSSIQITYYVCGRSRNNCRWASVNSANFLANRFSYASGVQWSAVKSVPDSGRQILHTVHSSLSSYSGWGKRIAHRRQVAHRPRYKSRPFWNLGPEKPKSPNLELRIWKAVRNLGSGQSPNLDLGVWKVAKFGI